MDNSQRLIDSLQIYSGSQFWRDRDQNLVEEQLWRRRLHYVSSRLRRDHFYTHHTQLPEPDFASQKAEAQQGIDDANSRLDAQFTQFVEVRNLLTVLFPSLLGKMPFAADRASFEKLDRAIVMRQFGNLLGRVLELDAEN